ncbi:MAG: CoA transferase [Acidimicrobiaceae bacterium]|nr:CoA transferase [Acidimicrobiia bacterium]MCY4493247.1 CoA transferase [Acidimicrobiaceae bacterium]
MVAAADDLARRTARWGTTVVVDGPALLGERAALSGMGRNGDTSVGGSARFVRAADGWIVLNLPRPADVESLPALVGRSLDADDWPAIAGGIASLTGAEVVETARLLGLAAAVPGSWSEAVPSPGRELHRGGGRRIVDRPLVVDLTSLWAGPLAGGLLADAGARVVKVEGAGRPDGARGGTPEFFNLLNHAKECVEVDFSATWDRALLRGLLRAADLVLEGSRPRVMDQLGIDPAELADAGVCWLSINAYGRCGDAALRVGFGDDTAVAGGLWLAGDPPNFVADAVADPIAGLAAAALGAQMLASEQAAVAEVPLARAAAWANSGAMPGAMPESTGPGMHNDGGRWIVDLGDERVPVQQPGHRRLRSAAKPVGSHNALLRAEFDTRR